MLIFLDQAAVRSFATRWPFLVRREGNLVHAGVDGAASPVLLGFHDVPSGGRLAR